MADSDIQALKERLKALQEKKKMESQPSQKEDTSKISQESQNDNISNVSSQVSQSLNPVPAMQTPGTPETKPREPDYSVFVNNIPPRLKKDQLDDHFSCCGSIKRSTIVQDNYYHFSKGYAYIEFEQKEGLENALKLDGSLLGGNTIVVKLKEKRKQKFRRSSRRRFRRS